MPKRVLIVDDSELMRRQVRRILEPDCHISICGEAENGAEALQKVQKYHPDLVVMDVFMPGMSGLAALREIKKSAPHLPVVVFTLSRSGDIRAESQKAGADAVLEKANGSVELLCTIRRLLANTDLSVTRPRSTNWLGRADEP